MNNGNRWQPYPDYKNPGVEWLEEIPTHWEIRRLKYAAPISTEKLAQKPDKSPYLGLEHIESKTGKLLLDEPIEQVESVVGSFNQGDVLFGKLRPYLAKVLFATFDGVCTTELLSLRPENCMDGKFLFYRLLSENFIELINSMTYGTKMPRANGDQIGNVVVGIPPLEEQRAIADFLDRETAKLDTLIAKKQRLMGLLQEQRTALISHAVTKGLNSNGLMKDSGVEWLGEIPEHWKVKRLKFVAAEPFKYGANESAELTDTDLPRYIRITDIREDGTLRDDTFRSLPKEVAEPYLLKHGDLLFARSGATVGKTFMYQDSWGCACFAGYLIRLRVNLTQTIPEFLNYFTSSTLYWNWISSNLIQATIQNVSAEKYANLSLAFPPLNEQRAIAAHLDQETAKINALIDKTKKTIEKLQEFRTALISAAVTGKIDVREACSRDDQK